MADQSHLREAYALMRAVYPRWAAQQDADSVRLWGSLLEDVSGDSLLAALRMIAAESKWPPTIAEIREAAGCEEPGTVERREASRAAAERHAEWVEQRRQEATRRAREGLRRAGKDPDSLKPGSVAELAKGIGR
jgi:hypothetical protein